MFWLLCLFVFFNPEPVLAVDWAYPINRYKERQSFKGFGQYFDKQWYLGKENQFPVQFTGFHTGLDLEIFPEELTTTVPVFAVSSGKIVFAGNVAGYGGVILLRPETGTVTFLYGHLRLTGIKVGQTLDTGNTLGYLGDAFSSQTGGERKHLHFAIYRGTDNYFKGYEKSLSAVNSKFLDPNDYLSQGIKVTPSPVVKPSSAQLVAKNEGFWTRLIIWLKSLF